MSKWRWFGNTLRKSDGSVEKQALNWNSLGARRRGRPKQTWKMTVLEEAGKYGKYGMRLTGWRASQMEMLQTWPVFLMEPPSLLLLLLLLLQQHHALAVTEA
jgi:hypothetical protein